MAGLLLCVALCLTLAACDSGKKEDVPGNKPVAETGDAAGAKKAASDVAPSEASAPEQPAPSSEELDRADSLVAFSNGVSMALSSGRYAQADVLMAYTKYYLAEWNLAKRPSVNPSEDDALARRLVPPPHLFTPEEEKALASHVQSMDKSLSSMRADYRALEKYVEDVSIQDDGAKGRQLGSSIAKAHAAYISARDAYLGIVEAKAAPAEELLLRGHPLKRQIQAADNIFGVYLKTAELLTPEKHDRDALVALRKKLAENIEDGSRPPFMASPEAERPYREFLRHAAQYAASFDRGLNEGFHNTVRQELNNAALASRAAYNDFVRVANRLR